MVAGYSCENSSLSRSVDNFLKYEKNTEIMGQETITFRVV